MIAVNRPRSTLGMLDFHSVINVRFEEPGLLALHGSIIYVSGTNLVGIFLTYTPQGVKEGREDRLHRLRE